MDIRTYFPVKRSTNINPSNGKEGQFAKATTEDDPSWPGTLLTAAKTDPADGDGGGAERRAARRTLEDFLLNHEIAAMPPTFTNALSYRICFHLLQGELQRTEEGSTHSGGEGEGEAVMERLLRSDEFILGIQVVNRILSSTGQGMADGDGVDCEWKMTGKEAWAFLLIVESVIRSCRSNNYFGRSRLSVGTGMPKGDVKGEDCQTGDTAAGNWLSQESIYKLKEAERFALFEAIWSNEEPLYDMLQSEVTASAVAAGVRTCTRRRRTAKVHTPSETSTIMSTMAVVSSPAKALNSLIAMDSTKRGTLTGLEYFFRKLIRISAWLHERLTTQLPSSHTLLHLAWTLFIQSLEIETTLRLFYGRHLLTIISCGFYSVAKLMDCDVPFTRIIAAFSQVMPHLSSNWYRSIPFQALGTRRRGQLCVVGVGERGDLVKFYNECYLPQMKSMIYGLRPSVTVTPLTDSADSANRQLRQSRRVRRETRPPQMSPSRKQPSGTQMQPFPSVHGNIPISRNVTLSIHHPILSHEQISAVTEVPSGATAAAVIDGSALGPDQNTLPFLLAGANTSGIPHILPRLFRSRSDSVGSNCGTTTAQAPAGGSICMTLDDLQTGLTSSVKKRPRSMMTTRFDGDNASAADNRESAQVATSNKILRDELGRIPGVARALHF